MHHDGTIQTPAGTAPADAFEPLGSAIHRPADAWIACNPESPHEDATRRLREAAAHVTGPDDGLRVRFVQPQVTGSDCILRTLPNLLANLEEADYAFVHAELMEGPETGIYIAIDNRMPALITQQWLAKAGDPLETLEHLNGHPIHVNLHLHRAQASLLDLAEETDAAQALHAAAKLGNPIHQVTLTHSEAQQTGVSVGVESVINEQGSPGGMPAIAPENHAPRGIQ